jgi:hypothetical protein
MPKRVIFRINFCHKFKRFVYIYYVYI